MERQSEIMAAHCARQRPLETDWWAGLSEMDGETPQKEVRKAGFGGGPSWPVVWS